jgi:hypothetical protein
LGVTLDLENALHAESAGLCREVMRCLLNARGVAVPDDIPHEGEQGAGTRAREVRTLFGPVLVEGRSYYHNADDGAGRFPFDDALGLVNGATPALVARAVEAALKEPYVAAALSFSQSHAVEMTPDVLMTYPRTLAAVADRFVRDATPAEQRAMAGTPACACVAADGTGMPMRRRELRRVKGRGPGGRAKTREVKIGAVFEMQPAPGNPEDRARVPDSTTYAATLGRKAEFADRLRVEFDRRFPVPPEVTLYITDGAKWLRDVRRTHFPFAIEILDFYHAAEHLGPILDLAEITGKERQRTFRKWRRWLKRGKVDQLIDMANEFQNTENSATKVKSWKRAIGYFKDNRSRMKYNEYLAKGWFIGSGVVESGCKSVVGKRFKQPGMLWSRKGADALLPFRVAYMSGRYDELWYYIIGSRKQVRIA